MTTPILPFLQLHVVKPATSKAGNSEQYVICLGYNGANALSQKLMERLKLVFGEIEILVKCTVNCYVDVRMQSLTLAIS